MAPRKEGHQPNDKPVSAKILPACLGLCPVRVSVLSTKVPVRSIPKQRATRGDKSKTTQV
jgi:hypothetical protein